MRTLVDDHPLLDHAFFKRLERREAEPDELIRWALQDRHVSYTFPRLIALIVASFAAQGPWVTKGRMALVENLWEEMGEGDYERAHSTLMDALLTSIGVSADDLDVARMDSTATFLDMQLELSRQDPFAGMGAFCYANEYLALKEYPPIQDAVLHIWPEADIRFFEANWEADGHHTELVEESIERLASSNRDLEKAKLGARRALQARMGFYDELCPAPG
jgi:pyrroloquinoline-quinone synthase